MTKAEDVFSVGMIFYVILRREHPNIDILRNREDVTRYCQQSLINRDLKQLTLKCVEHNPSKRPQMLEVRNKLHSLLNEQNASEIAADVATVLKTYTCNTFVKITSEFVHLDHAANV